jgi:hypothetical protein
VSAPLSSVQQHATAASAGFSIGGGPVQSLKTGHWTLELEPAESINWAKSYLDAKNIKKKKKNFVQYLVTSNLCTHA